MLLYHYTNAAALQSILERRELWATHYAFLNDPTEGTHIVSIIKSAADGSEEFDDDYQALTWLADSLQRSREAFAGAAGPNPAFVVALSEKFDSLAQWRSYAGPSGFALGFDSDKLVDPNAQYPNPRLAKVEYDESVQRATVTSLLTEFLEFHRKPWPKAKGAMSGYLGHLAKLGLEIKNPWFHEEAEWRLVFEPTWPNVSPLVRASTNGLIPYVVIPLDTDALCQLVIGPWSDSERQRIPLRHLAQSQGYEVEIVSSRGTLRG